MAHLRKHSLSKHLADSDALGGNGTNGHGHILPLSHKDASLPPPPPSSGQVLLRLFSFPLKLLRSRLLIKLLAFVAFLYGFFYSLNSFSPTSNALPKTTHLLNNYFDQGNLVPPYFDPGYGPNLVLSQGAEYSFSWAHWVNLTELNDLPESWRFQDYVAQPYSTPPPKTASTYQLRRLGQTFLAAYAKPVAKILFLGKVVEPVILDPAARDQNNKNENNNNNDLAYEQQVFDVLTEIEENGLLPPFNPATQSKSVLRRMALDVDESLYEWDIDEELLSLAAEIANATSTNSTNSTDSNTTSILEQVVHAQGMNHSHATITTAQKYFHELRLRGRPELGNHYDWRFFRQVRPEQDMAASLHHLFRAWVAFTEQEGVISWLAHGALMGWFWNGLTMPWDMDLDVQMPVRELDRLARKYNNTLVVQDPSEGNGRFLIEVSPAYVQRVLGNGNNVIDARFIDVRSGLYLDITGLAYNHPKDANQVGCKSPHYYLPTHISPLHLTTFEGMPFYVPHEYRWALREEYRGFDNPRFEGHAYNKDLRLWLDIKQCEVFDHDDQGFNTTDTAAAVNGTDDAVVNTTTTFFGPCDTPAVWARYRATQHLTALHYEEFAFLKQNEDDATVSGDDGDGDNEDVHDMMLEFPDQFAEFVRRFEPVYDDPRYIPGVVKEQ